MMNELPDSDYKDKINAASYPVLESSGVVWAYLGTGEQAPAPANFEWTQLPAFLVTGVGNAYLFTGPGVQQGGCAAVLDGDLQET